LSAVDDFDTFQDRRRQFQVDAVDLSLGPGRYRIHFGGIDEVDSLGQGVIQLGVGFGFTVLLTPGHRSQADTADFQISLSQTVVLNPVSSR